MITIQSGMLIALGFLAAALFGLLVAPAFWRRAVRLTTRRIKETMPLSELEIAADRDRIRAEYAIKMHKLETLVEQVKLAGARQQIDINRRDARVNMLEADLERLQASLEEVQNAKRVLEQTIADRLPRVESRLTEAKKVLHAREREIGELTKTAASQVQALAAASSINAEQKAEIERLNDIVGSRGLRQGDRDAAGRAELEALRAKSREQAQLLERLQSQAGRPGVALVGNELGEATTAVSSEAAEQHAELEREIAALRARGEDQSAEIARLKAAIAVFEKNADGEMLGSIRESRLALKARVQSLEAQAVQQSDTVAKLRSELAAANERLARQAAHFTGELKRLGTGGSSTQDRRRSAAAASRPTLADRVAMAGLDLDEAAAPGAAEASYEADENAQPAPGEAVRSVGTLDTVGAEPSAAEAQVESNAEARRGSAGRPRLLDRIAGLSRTS